MAILTTDINTKKRDALFEFTQGVDIDCFLGAQEIRVQKTWARGLGAVGILTVAEVATLIGLFDQALELMNQGEFNWRKADEDVHMNLERFITERAGELGKKMHLGRSRNDLIATTLKLFVYDSLDDLSKEVSRLISALIMRGKEDMDVIIPGQTHLQNGQPIRLSHFWSCYAHALQRDFSKINWAKKRAVESMPLGSAALSGTPLPLNLPAMARELGFENASANSYDSISERDYILDALGALSNLAIHLSRLSEDIIIWASSNIGLFKLPPELSTGSSIMPNKRNPDVAELTRGKSAHIMGALSNALILLKGLPTSYNSDLHEIKSVYLRAATETKSIFSVFPDFVAEMGVNKKVASNLLNQGHLLATEIADELTAQGHPFRESYQLVAALVKKADEYACQVHQLPIDVAQGIAPALSQKFLLALTPEYAVERRANCGGSAKEQIEKSLEHLAATLSQT